MTERKQRIHVMMSSETVATLEDQIPGYQRSEYIEHAVRDRLGLPPMERQQGQKGFAVYERRIDDGFGRQTVYVQDGKIVSQFLGSAPGMHHSYTGDGNPEWIGQDASALRGKGFKKLRGNRVQETEMQWLESQLREY